jgi:hypothetical protein
MAVTIARSNALAEVGANAGAWTVDMGVAAPGNLTGTGLTTTPPAPWVPVGAISDKGIARSFNEKTQDIYALGLVSPFMALVTQSTASFTFDAYESGRDIVRSVAYRKPLSAVSASLTTGAWNFAETGTGVIDLRAWLFAVMTSGTSFEWYYLPNAMVAMTKDQVFVNSAPAGIEFAVTPFPDATGNTIYHSGQLPLNVYGS